MATPKQALGIAAVVVGSTVAVSGAALGGCLASPPASIATNCSSDVGAALSSEVNGLPPNSTVNLTAGACYLINSTVHIAKTTNLTVNGNGATLLRTTPGASGTKDPLLFLTQNAGLKISNLKVTGAYNDTNGGPSYEGQYGILAEANHGVSISNMTMSNVQGDFINLQAPFDVSPDQSLNTAVDIEGSTFTNAGYHGLTVESVNGLTLNGDSFTGMGTDAMDFEYDVDSTSFDAQGNAQYAAQDNVKITNDYWANFGADWFASLQGQQPGVQSQNVTLSANTINGMNPLIQVTATNPYLTPKQYWNTGLTITNNKGLQPAISTAGGGAYGTEAAMQIQGVVGLSISGNTLPLYAPEVLSVIQAFENQNMAISHNQFVGAVGILEPVSAANTGPANCGNSWGVSGSLSDPTC